MSSYVHLFSLNTVNIDVAIMWIVPNANFWYTAEGRLTEDSGRNI